MDVFVSLITGNGCHVWKELWWYVYGFGPDAVGPAGDVK